MYNGSGNSYNKGPYRRGSGIPQRYLYIGVGVAVLLGIWLLMSFFRAGIDSYFALGVGILLVLGNLRDLIASYQQRGQVALMNTLLGTSLVFFFLGRGAFLPLGVLWYVPAIALALIAAPLMLGRAVVYGTYVNSARRAIGTVKNVVGSRIKTY